MQLKKIKLAGFKSFVDPTTVLVPSHLVAVVGPNGCGKSNIIDAVCWVMGESSAKYLRGESLTDVIFSGSTSRKPVGQASVELVFDNSDGSIGGEFASFSEISIRRVINREADSTYYLNGTRCRRRDIHDIFLGTGLGPRSYSIIGQNMISRIIEAKPDEMRVYLEEAAGISKYKERRRETENRIHHTKENLLRLNDIRTELEKQLTHLKRQATAAEKYKTLKEQERAIRAQFYAVQWREIDAQMVNYTLQIKNQETGLEACQATVTQLELNSEKHRNDQRLANEAFQEVQKRYYTVGNEITRLEQEIRHTQEREQQLKHDIEQIEADWLRLNADMEQGEDESQELAQEITELEPATAAAKNNVDKLTNESVAAEGLLQQWQDRWDAFNQKLSKATQTAQVEQTRIQHLEQRIASLKQRQIKLTSEQEQIDFGGLTNEQAVLSEQVAAATQQAKMQDDQLIQLRNNISSFQSNQQDVSNRLNQLRNQLQQLRGEQSSLQALQQTALGQRNQPAVEWLTKHKLDQLPRLAQEIEVEAGWDAAVEKVLGAYLQAVCVKDMGEAASQIDGLQEGNLCLFAAKSQSEPTVSAHKASSLASKVRSDWSVDALLASIYTADSLTEAMELSKKLAPHESVVTRDGIWLSSSWFKVSREKNPEAGVFQREQELKKINQLISQHLEDESTLEQQLQDIKEQIKEFELQREELQETTNDYRKQLAQLAAQQTVKQNSLAELQKRSEQYNEEQQEITAELEQTVQELEQARSTWQDALHELERDGEEKAILLTQRDELRDKRAQCQEQLNQAKQQLQNMEIRFQTAKSQRASLQQNVSRLHQQLEVLAERKSILENERESVKSTENLQEVLSDALASRLTIENELATKRATVEMFDQELRQFESQRQEAEREIMKFRNNLESLRIEWQGLKIKSENIFEKLKATNYVLEDILKELPAEAAIEEWQAQLEQIDQRIARLGAINLVAIEEYAICADRKQYLDKQHHDLSEGLATLEDAIEKIDKETRARFKETFDNVNAHFQELFPKIFGGGRCSLEMTSDNLLDAGVVVMACPPGKRNSSIHLLSGGEKAMSAIALVFSIFQLNPAPFCMLDEVDAPLDDANVGRFCETVKAMSAKTQFLFISHNKLAIEMAEHLIGVTMHEPGVSRLVSVNIQEAIQLAGV